MSRESGIDGRREYPELSDIDHHQHDQPCLPHSGVMSLIR